MKSADIRKTLKHIIFYDSVNVDGPNHYFKNEFVLPWLDKVLAE